MKANVSRAELRNAAESREVLSINNHDVRVFSTSQTAGGKERFSVEIDGKNYDFARYQAIQKLLGIGASSTTKRTSTVVPKSQRAEKTAANVDETITRRYSFKGLSVEDTQNLAYQRVDRLREEQLRIEREINLLLTFTREESIEKERMILQAAETAANGRKRDLKARAERLHAYIDTYAKRIGDTMLSGQFEKAQILVATQAARMSRAQILIAQLTK